MSLIKDFPNSSSWLKHALLIRKPPTRHSPSIQVPAPTRYRCPHLTIWKYHLSPRSNWPICWVCPLNVPCSSDTCEFRLVAFRTFYSRWHCLERCFEGQMWLQYPLLGREHSSTRKAHGPRKNANATARTVGSVAGSQTDTLLTRSHMTTVSHDHNLP